MSVESALVSIVIPTYNSERYICHAVDSCLTQTYPHCEIIVVDDGSTDNTGKLLNDRYGDRVRYIHKQNGGASSARNLGTHEANGEFVHYCDADDRLLPTIVARCLEVLQENPEIALVYTDYRFVQEDGKTIIPDEHPVWPSGDVFCELLTGNFGNFIVTSSIMVRRQVVLDTGGFNETLSVAEDWALWLRIAAEHAFGVINDVLVLCRRLPGGLHTSQLQMAKGRLGAIQMVRHYPGRERCLSDAAYDRLEADRHHVIAMIYWRMGRRAEARQEFQEAITLTESHANMRRLLKLLTYFLPSSSAKVVGQFGQRLKALRFKRS